MANPVAPVASVNILFCVISTVAAATRLQRTYSKTKTFQFHDVMLVLALLCGLTEASLQIVETRFGVGANYDETKLGELKTFYNLFTGLFVSYFLCNLFVKLSLLSFYRLLSRDQKFYRIILVMSVISIGFGVSSILVFLLQCLPMAKQWNPTLPGTCINLDAFLYSNAIIMICTDLVLYILPIMIVREVQLSRAKAAAMNVLFAMGFIVVIASCLRLFYLRLWLESPQNELYYLGLVLIWCTVENHLAIIIICLPAVKSVLVAFAPSITSIPSGLWSNSKRRSELPQYNHQPRASATPSEMLQQHHQHHGRKGSWFSWTSTSTASTDKSRLSTIVESIHHNRTASSKTGSRRGLERVDSLEIELRGKQPSVSVSEVESSSRPSLERADSAEGGGAYTHYVHDHVGEARHEPVSPLFVRKDTQ